MNPAQWDAPYPMIVAALFVIVMLRANGTYWLGRAGSAGARRTRLATVMESPGYLRAVERIDRFGPPVIAASFLTVGFQTLANLAAGATAMRQRHYLPAVTIGSVAWAFLYATIGTVGFDVFVHLYRLSPTGALVAGLLLVGAIAGYLAWVISHRRARRS